MAVCRLYWEQDISRAEELRDKLSNLYDILWEDCNLSLEPAYEGMLDDYSQELRRIDREMVQELQRRLRDEIAWLEEKLEMLEPLQRQGRSINEWYSCLYQLGRRQDQQRAADKALEGK